MSTLLSLCEGNPPVTGGFPSKRASYTKTIVMSWCRLLSYTLFSQIYSKEVLFNALCSISDSLITEDFSCVKTSHWLRPGQFKNNSWMEQNISHFMQVMMANGTAFLLIVLAHMCLVWGIQLLNLVDNVKISLEMECTGLRTFELKLFCLSYDSW